MRPYMNPWTLVWTLCLLSWTARARPVALDPIAGAPPSQVPNSGGSDSAVVTTPGSVPTGGVTNRGDIVDRGGQNQAPGEIAKPDQTAVATTPVADPIQDIDVQTPIPVTTSPDNTNPGDHAQPDNPGPDVGNGNDQTTSPNGGTEGDPQNGNSGNENDAHPTTGWFPPEAPTASPGGDDRVNRLRHYLEGRGCPPDAIERILSRYTGPRPYANAIAIHRASRGKGRRRGRKHPGTGLAQYKNRINKYKLSSHYSYESMESDESISACDFSDSFSDSYSNSFSESFSESFSFSKYRAKRNVDASGESEMDGGHDASGESGEGSPNTSGESAGPGSVKSGEHPTVLQPGNSGESGDHGPGNSGESGEPGAANSGESTEPGVGNQDSDEGNESASKV